MNDADQKKSIKFVLFLFFFFPFFEKKTDSATRISTGRQSPRHRMCSPKITFLTCVFLLSVAWGPLFLERLSQSLSSNHSEQLIHHLRTAENLIPDDLLASAIRSLCASQESFLAGFFFVFFFSACCFLFQKFGFSSENVCLKFGRCQVGLVWSPLFLRVFFPGAVLRALFWESVIGMRHFFSFLFCEFDVCFFSHFDNFMLMRDTG